MFNDIRKSWFCDRNIYPVQFELDLFRITGNLSTKDVIHLAIFFNTAVVNEYRTMIANEAKIQF